MAVAAVGVMEVFDATEFGGFEMVAEALGEARIVRLALHSRAAAQMVAEYTHQAVTQMVDQAVAENERFAFMRERLPDESPNPGYRTFVLRGRITTGGRISIPLEIREFSAAGRIIHDFDLLNHSGENPTHEPLVGRHFHRYIAQFEPLRNDDGTLVFHRHPSRRATHVGEGVDRIAPGMLPPYILAYLRRYFEDIVEAP